MVMRKCHMLKENKITHAPDRIITYDTETKWFENKDETRTHQLKVGVARYYDSHNKIPIRDEFVFHTQESFWNWVEGKIPTKTTVHLFAHNAQFDSNIVGMFDELPKRGWELDRVIINANIFIVKWIKGNHGDKQNGITSNVKSLVCLDTMNFFKSSLEEIGKTLGIKKLKVDFDTVSLEELTTYCKRDVEITEAIILKWYEFIEKNDLGNSQPTLASQAFGSFKHRFMKHKIYIHDNLKAIQLERESYRGGRTECFHLQTIANKLYDLDFNSLYPSVMLGKKYPVNFKSFTIHNDIESLKNAMSKYLVIAELKIKIDKPIVAIRKERLLFPIGTFTNVFCTPEIEMLLERGCIIEVGRMATYEGAYIFDDYVNFFYNERMKAKSQNDKAKSEMLKIMLNSLYGKFGQRGFDTNEIGTTTDTRIGIEPVYEALTGKRYMRKQFAGKVFRVERTDEESYDSFPAVASFCTSYARQKLLEGIEKAGWENVFYVDTDSLFVNELGYQRLKPLIDDKKLGYLKIEAIGFSMLINGCKDYIFNMQTTSSNRHDNPIQNKFQTRIKGIPRRAVKINDTDYEMIRFDKFNTNVRNGNLSSITERKMVKHLSRIYTKGIVDTTGKITPMEMFENVERPEAVKVGLEVS